MVNRKVVAVDVDSVVVDLSVDWWKFLESKTSTPQSFDVVTRNYDLGLSYPDVPKDVALSFWKGRNLYDEKTPFPGCVEALEEFRRSGYIVTFVSHVEGDHGKSKVQFLKHHFPSMAGFFATRQKGLMRPEVAFDDRLYHLDSYRMMKHDCVTVRVVTPDDQVHQTEYDHIQMSVAQWQDEEVIQNIIRAGSR